MALFLLIYFLLSLLVSAYYRPLLAHLRNVFVYVIYSPAYYTRVSPLAGPLESSRLSSAFRAARRPLVFLCATIPSKSFCSIGVQTTPQYNFPYSNVYSIKNSVNFSHNSNFPTTAFSDAPLIRVANDTSYKPVASEPCERLLFWTQLSIKNKTIWALADTGSCENVMSETFWLSLPNKPALRPPGDRVLLSAHGKTLQVLGWALMKFEINKVTLFHEIGIVKDVPLDLLIRGEVIRIHSCNIHYSHQGPNKFELCTPECATCLRNKNLLAQNNSLLRAEDMIRNIDFVPPVIWPNVKSDSLTCNNIDSCDFSDFSNRILNKFSDYNFDFSPNIDRSSTPNISSPSLLAFHIDEESRNLRHVQCVQSERQLMLSGLYRPHRKRRAQFSLIDKISQPQHCKCAFTDRTPDLRFRTMHHAIPLAKQARMPILVQSRNVQHGSTIGTSGICLRKIGNTYSVAEHSSPFSFCSTKWTDISASNSLLLSSNIFPISDRTPVFAHITNDQHSGHDVLREFSTEASARYSNSLSRRKSARIFQSRIQQEGCWTRLFFRLLEAVRIAMFALVHLLLKRFWPPWASYMQ